MAPIELDKSASASRLDSVEGIILAGEYHWNGSVFEELRPRPLLPVAETPLIEHVLGWLKSGGVGGATICANGSTGMIRRHLTDECRLAIGIRYYEDGTPRGAAGCVRDAALSSDARTLIVADGASIPSVDLPRLVAEHRSSGAALTIVASHQPEHGGRAPALRPAGIYVFDRRILEAVPETSFQDIKETLIPKLYRDGHRVDLFIADEVSPRVLNAESYLSVNHWMIRRTVASARITHQKMHRPELVAHDSARIADGATIIGPVILGRGVCIESGATIVGPTCIGAGSIVRANAVVARTVIWDRCEIGERAMVDRSLLADDVRVEAGDMVTHAVRTPQSDQPHVPSRVHGTRGRPHAARQLVNTTAL